MHSPENLNEAMFKMFIFMMEKHHSLIDKYAEDCPYHMKDHTVDDLVFHVWGMFEAVLPNTNIRIVDEYAKTHIHDPTMASMIKRIDNIYIDTFEISHVDYTRGTVQMRGMRDGLTYDAAATTDYLKSINLDKEIQFMICPWHQDGKTYCIMTTMCPFRYETSEMKVSKYVQTDSQKITHEVENEFLNEAESIRLYEKSRLGPALRKYPAQWSRAICDRLGINDMALSKKECTEVIVQILTVNESLQDVLAGLADDEQQCASHMIKQDGFARLDNLEKIFGKDDTEYWWQYHRPKSTIGALRRTGLVIVGMRQVGQDTHKVAQITIDIMLRIKEMRSIGMLKLAGMQGQEHESFSEYVKSDDDDVKMSDSHKQESTTPSNKPRRKKWHHAGSIRKNQTRS